jgi:hypothetical protein
MSRPLIECEPTAQTKALVTRAWARYHASVQEHGPADEWDRQVIDTAIRAMAMQGRRFSVNDFRDLLPEVRKCLISRRLIEAQRVGWIRWAGVTSSTLKSTKAAHVNVYAPIPGALPATKRGGRP